MATDTYTGQTLDGKYRLTTLLGKGGMGAVYRGEHVVIGKQVAVKFLHAELAGSEEVVKRFYREAQAAAAIGHDGIIDVMDVGVSPTGEPYLVMEYLEGESLADLLVRSGPLDPGSACGILEPALLALNAAHAKGIVHRDLKPDNIFIAKQPDAPPKVKLIDFGISKFASGPGGEKLTQTGSVMGTPAYMAPEQARGSTDLDHRADIYSMGVILYEMLTGQLPFNGDNFTEIIVAILTDNPVPPQQAFDGFPMEAEEVLLRSLVKDPAGRYQNCIEFIEALKGIGSFGERQEKLTMLAAKITHTTFASGSLGPEVRHDSSGAVAADVLAQVSGGATPSAWSGTNAGPQAKRGGKGKLLLIGALAAAISIGGIVAAVVLWGGDDPAPATVPIAPAAPAAATTVSITVKGAPAGARIYFDDMLVTVNPFKVKQGEAIQPLKIEAEGFEPFVLSVAPSEDREIDVALKPAVQATEPPKEPETKSRKGKRRKKSSSKTADPAPAAPPPSPAPPSKPKKKLQKGAKGTKMVDTFE